MFADGDGQRAQVFVNLHNGDCFITQAKYCIIINLKGNNNGLNSIWSHKETIFVTFEHLGRICQQGFTSLTRARWLGY